MMHKFGNKVFRYRYFPPIISQTRLAFQPKYLVFG